MSSRFEIGHTYYDRSACDHECIFFFMVLARTAKTITFTYHGETKRRGIYIANGVECFRPFGTYSMCAIVNANSRMEGGGMNAERRKLLTDAETLLDQARNLIEEARDAGQEAYDNLPESFQNGDKGQAMSEAIDNLEQAVSNVEDVVTAISDARGE